jgi:Rieske Fe-S protein
MKLDQSLLQRRDVLSSLLGVGAAGLTAATAETMLGYLTGREVKVPDEVVVTTPEIEKLEQQGYVLVPFGPRPVLIFRLPDGELRAFSAVCTHGACNVRYRPEQNDIYCGCHQGRFTVEGQNVPGTPPPAPLRRFYLYRLADDTLIVRASPMDADSATQSEG